MLQRILIVDDEPLARERVRAFVLARAPHAEVREVGDGASAVRTIREWAPHALFLDIQMPALDGFEVLAAVGAEAMPPTAFVTAYDAHALRAFEAAAVDYLLKPFDDARFQRAWERLARAHVASTVMAEARALTRLLDVTGASAAAAPADAPAGVSTSSSPSPTGTTAAAPPEYVQRLVVRELDRTYPVAIADVKWMQSDGNYVDLHTAHGRHTVREPLGSLEKRLDPARFVRIHRGTIVAIDQIRELHPWFGGDQVLLLKDGTKLRVSRTRRELLLARLEGRR